LRKTYDVKSTMLQNCKNKTQHVTKSGKTNSLIRRTFLL
jgi:hypothetical protein